MSAWKQKIDEAKALVQQVKDLNANDGKSASGIDSGERAAESRKKLAAAQALAAEAKSMRADDETRRTEELLSAFDAKSANADADQSVLDRKNASTEDEWQAPSKKGVLCFSEDSARRIYGKSAARLAKADMKTLTEGDDNAGGYLVAPEYHQELFAENRLAGNALRNLGWVNVHTTNSKKIYIPAGDDVATMGWVGENSPAPSTDKSFTQLGIDIFKAVGIAKLSDELNEDSDPAALEIAIQELGKLGAILEEQAWLFGSGAGQPKGILKSTEVNTQAFSDATAQGQLDGVLDLQMLVLTTFYAPATGVLVAPRRYAHWRKAKDDNNNYLFNIAGTRTPGAVTKSVYDGGDVLGLPIGISPNLPTTIGTALPATPGEGNKDAIVAGDWSEAHAFVRRATTVDTNTQSDTAFANGQIHVRLSFRQGFTAERQPNAFAVGVGSGLVA